MLRLRNSRVMEGNRVAFITGLIRAFGVEESSSISKDHRRGWHFSSRNSGGWWDASLGGCDD